MKFLISVIIIFSTLTFGLPAQAATTTATGKVSTMRLYGSGMMLIYGLNFDGKTSLSHCTGTQSGFLIPHDYEKMDKLLSLLLTAKATSVTVTVGGLDVGSSCWAPTFNSSSYIDFS